jgi:hypothetical protein
MSRVKSVALRRSDALRADRDETTRQEDQRRGLRNGIGVGIEHRALRSCDTPSSLILFRSADQWEQLRYRRF